MNKIATILSVLVFSTSFVFALDKARAIVEKAIQAQGGETRVAKLRTMRIKVEGTAALAPGQPDVSFTIQDLCHVSIPGPEVHSDSGHRWGQGLGSSQRPNAGHAQGGSGRDEGAEIRRGFGSPCLLDRKRR